MVCEERMNGMDDTRQRSGGKKLERRSQKNVEDTGVTLRKVE